MCNYKIIVLVIIVIIIISLTIIHTKEDTKIKTIKYYSVDEMIENFDNLTEEEKNYVNDYLEDPKTINFSGKPKR